MRSRKNALILVIIVILAVSLACRIGKLEPTPTPEAGAPQTGETSGGESTGGEQTSGEATTPGPESQVPEDVPLLDNPIGLLVTADGTYIKYQAIATVEVATEFYKSKLAELGWEQINKQDVGFGSSITLLRGKSDKNITVTINSIPESDQVRVLISVIKK